jgi:hypothetical protein
MVDPSGEFHHRPQAPHRRLADVRPAQQGNEGPFRAYNTAHPFAQEPLMKPVEVERMSLQGRVRVTQIITGALVFGAVGTLLILFAVRHQNPVPPNDPPLVSYIALGYTAVMAIVALVVPNLIAAAGRRRLANLPAGTSPAADLAAWYALYHTCLVVRLANLEGTALFLILAYFIDSWALPLLVTPALIALMLWQFPTADRFERWVEAQKERAYQDRPLS